MVVNLVGMPAEINIPEVEVEFALEGGQPYFFASADTLYKVAFKEMQKYFGYEDAKSADEYWSREFNNFSNQLYATGEAPSVVNGVNAYSFWWLTKEPTVVYLMPYY